MSLDIDAIAKDMIAAAKGVVGDRWPTTQKYIEIESKLYAQRLASIEMMYKDGSISKQRAKDHIEIQNEAWNTTLLCVIGLNQLMIEEMLNAAIRVIGGVVNKLIGFELFSSK